MTIRKRYYPVIVHFLWLCVLTPFIEELDIYLINERLPNHIGILLFWLIHFRQIRNVKHPFLYSSVLIGLRLLCDSTDLIQAIYYHALLNITVFINFEILTKIYTQQIKYVDCEKSYLPLPILAFINELGF